MASSSSILNTLTKVYAVGRQPITLDQSNCCSAVNGSENQTFVIKTTTFTSAFETRYSVTETLFTTASVRADGIFYYNVLAVRACAVRLKVE